jgi:hypothetical protein
MPHPLDRLDADVVTTASGDRDVSRNVLEIQCACASDPEGALEVLCVLGAAPGPAAAAALLLEPLLDQSRKLIGLNLNPPCHLIGLALDLTGNLIDLTLDAARYIVRQIVPVASLCGRGTRHGDEDKGDNGASLDSAH